MKTALLVIDLQKAFYEKAPADFEAAVVQVNRLIPLFRARGHEVIWVQHANQNVQPEQAHYAFVEGLIPEAQDFRVHKTYGSAFHDGQLATFLKERDIQTIYLCGFAAENCILSTARAAMDQDFQPFLVRETIVSSDRKKTDCVLNIQAHLTVDELIKKLE